MKSARAQRAQSMLMSDITTKEIERLLRMLRRGRRPDASTLLHQLGRIPCAIAMSGAEEYVAAAKLQVRRIAQATSARGSRVFREIHFYFICWDAVWERLTFVKDETHWRPLKHVWKKYRADAERYVLGRGQLEHYKDWLAGRPKYEPLQAWDHGSLVGTTFTLAGRHWDVSRASVRKLESLVRDFKAAVEMAARDELEARRAGGANADGRRA